MALGSQADNRWELYKILGDRMRLRMLAAAAQEELAIGELAEALGESQPNVSRQVAPLRALGLLDDRRQGTRVLVRVPDALRRDPVISDALQVGRSLLEAEGVSERIAAIVQRRDAAAREFFAQSESSASQSGLAEELPAYLAALAVLLPRRGLAIDAGTGDGRLLDVLAPLFERVVGFDREPARLSRAQQRIEARGYGNVRLVAADLHDAGDVDRVAELGLADVVIASRILHHAPRPAETVAHLASLLAPGGTLVVLDYLTHDDEGMREQQADLWLGFEPAELEGFACAAGLADVRTQSLPGAFHGTGPDRHLTWQLLSARRAAAVSHRKGLAAPPAP